MNHYFITGTSRGIGKAIAEQLLLDPNNLVTGYARSCSISHERYCHVEVDLSDVEKVSKIIFPELPQAQKMALINNAGAIGKIRHAGKFDADVIAPVFNLNLIAPVMLCNAFLKKYTDNPAQQIILNISSGAGKNAIDGWSLYCANKAGLDMFSKVVAEELKLSDKKNRYIFSVAPGVVDTAMQEHIRTSESSEFSQIQRFKDLKKTEQLASPSFVAGKYLAILELPEKFKDVLFSVKDI